MSDRKTGCRTISSDAPNARLPALGAAIFSMSLLACGAVFAQDSDALPEGQDASFRMEAVDGTPELSDLAGPYLAARQAFTDGNLPAAVEYYARAVKQDPKNFLLIDNYLYALIAVGQEDKALDEALAIDARGDATDMTTLVIRAGLARQQDWQGLLASLGDLGDGKQEGVVLLDGMLRAWALMGEGKAGEAIAQLEALKGTRGAQGMVNYNLALAKALSGDFEAALGLVNKDGAGQHLLGALAKAEMLAQLDRRDEAVKLLDAQSGGADDPTVIALRAKIASGKAVPFTAIADARDAVAQVYLTFASVLGSFVDPDPLSLVHARLAVWVAPDFGEARLVLAQILQESGQYSMATEQYDALAKLGEVRPVAELSRIDALARGGLYDEALEAAEALTKTHPNLPPAWIARGDILRQTENFAEAAKVYGRALEIIEDDDSRWFPYFARGISHERSGNYEQAEADLRAALVISPNHPQILNYLGYTLIDRGLKLDEALEMIQQAVQLQPDGYILDSLGWGFYRLGRYDEAVIPMERAAAQMADDPLVNDHLGDVYWMVGRYRESNIQWQRALSLMNSDTPSSEEVDADRIRDKLERGLQAVLDDEAAGKD